MNIFTAINVNVEPLIEQRIYSVGFNGIYTCPLFCLCVRAILNRTPVTLRHSARAQSRSDRGRPSSVALLSRDAHTPSVRPFLHVHLHDKVSRW